MRGFRKTVLLDWKIGKLLVSCELTKPSSRRLHQWKGCLAMRKASFGSSLLLTIAFHRIEADTSNWNRECVHFVQARLRCYTHFARGGLAWSPMLSSLKICAILPEILSCAETFMSLAKAHQFRADIDSLEKSFRTRAAEQASRATASILGHDVVGDPPELARKKLNKDSGIITSRRSRSGETKSIKEIDAEKGSRRGSDDR